MPKIKVLQHHTLMMIIKVYSWYLFYFIILIIIRYFIQQHVLSCSFWSADTIPNMPFKIILNNSFFKFAIPLWPFHLMLKFYFQLLNIWPNEPQMNLKWTFQMFYLHFSVSLVNSYYYSYHWWIKFSPDCFTVSKTQQWDECLLILMDAQLLSVIEKWKLLETRHHIDHSL